MASRTRGIARSWATLVCGTVLVRSLAFGFSIIAARVLEPTGFGAMAYGLTVATVASTFIVNATRGLPRFLSPRADEEQHASYFTNWMVMLMIAIGLSSTVMVASAKLTGIEGWMVIAVLANFLGFAAISLFRALKAANDQTGQIVVCFAIANGLQLVAIGALALLHWRDPALFLTVYGLSSVVVIAIMELVSPSGQAFVLALVSWTRIKEIGRFAAPIMLQAIFFPIWMGGDIILLQHLGQQSHVADYAVAKNLSNALYSAPAAMAMVVVPRAVNAGSQAARRLIGVTLGLTAGLTIPAMLVLIGAGGPIVRILFGDRYQTATVALPLLAAGMTIHGFYLVMEATWVGLGRTWVVAVTMAMAMLTTMSLSFWLIPIYGVRGAALAFTMGAVVQLAAIGVPTLWILAPRLKPTSPALGSRPSVVESD